MSKDLKVLFLGSKRLGLKVVQKIYSIAPALLIGAITIDDSEDSRSVFSELVNFFEKEKIPLETAKNRKHSETLIAELKPDLCLVVGWYWLIGTETLQSVPRGFIGIHNSLLPKYRGSSPLVWTMINDEKEAGFSLFSLTEGLDEGEIWATGKVAIEETDFVSDVLDKLETETLEVIRSAYPRILDGSLCPKEQKPEGATYCSPRFSFDGEIDWNRSAKEVYNFIRAQSEPYPGAFTYFKGEKLIIWKASPHKIPYYGTPGQVARIDANGVFVVCGGTECVILQTVELNGPKTRAEQIIRSVKTRFPRFCKYNEASS